MVRARASVGPPVDPRRLDPQLLVRDDEARAVARRDAPALALETEKSWGTRARHAHGELEGHAEKLDRVAHRARHVDRRAAERSLRVDAHAVLHRDAPPLEHEVI